MATRCARDGGGSFPSAPLRISCGSKSIAVSTVCGGLGTLLFVQKAATHAS
ncbi:MAG: hypothetical protein MUC87_04690 [Bacteroidia bacterium]|nr:hypothetical protein [Bacteroidia bacterium]